MTAYDTGSSGFNISVAVGKALKDKYGSDIRVLPAGNDVARLGPLKADRALFSAMGIGSFFAQEAVFEFVVPDWGPQRLRLILSSLDCNAISLGVAKDTGITQIKDLKGKRVGFVVGSPALNQNALAILAFGNLKKGDVKIVEFASNNAMWKGLLANEVDALVGSNISGLAKEAEASPRGLVYPLLPFADKEGWARMQKAGPHFQQHKATCGVGGFTKDKPGELTSYPYPIYLAYDKAPADQIYSLTKGMIEAYPAYKDVTPGASGLDARLQNLTWVLPYHEGAVKALKEAGVWTSAAEAHNAKLTKRQDTLTAAWKAFIANPPADKAAFATAWMAARKDALTKAGMDIIFE
jgi:TRAP transporter TAXI family solute receptor